MRFTVYLGSSHQRCWYSRCGAKVAVRAKTPISGSMKGAHRVLRPYEQHKICSLRTTPRLSTRWFWLTYWNNFAWNYRKDTKAIDPEVRKGFAITCEAKPWSYISCHAHVIQGGQTALQQNNRFDLHSNWLNRRSLKPLLRTLLHQTIIV